jgi:hypothetical protein
MDAKEIQRLVIAAIESTVDRVDDLFDEDMPLTEMNIRTYEKQGMLTRDAGFTIELKGHKFQVTIVEV